MLCALEDYPLGVYDAISVTNVFLKYELAKRGVETFDLWSHVFEIDVPNELRRIDSALHREAETHKEMRWAPLAFLRVLRRYFHYLQYKKRINIWLDHVKIDTLRLSSRLDKDLVGAATAVCSSRGIVLEVGDGRFDEYSGLDQHMFPEDIPMIRWPDYVSTRLTGLFRRFAGTHTLYEPYSNIHPMEKGLSSFKWWNSVAFCSLIYERLLVKSLGIKKRAGPLDQFAGFDPRHRRLIDTNNWIGFQEDEIVAINSALHGFYRKYNNNDIDRMSDALSAYFLTARISRIIILDSQVAQCRLLAYTARKSGVSVDYLPHGIVTESHTTNTSSPFSPKRVLAWNNTSAARYGMNGCSAISISHPSLSANARLEGAWSRQVGRFRRFLVLLPSTESFQLDSFERDLLDVNDAIESLQGVVDFKLHKSNSALARVREIAKYRLNLLLGVELSFIDPGLETLEVMAMYDMVVICRISTAIYEAAIYKIPFVVYMGDISHVGGLDGVRIPVANSSDSLVAAVNNFDFVRFSGECEKLRDSLCLGTSPFDRSSIGCAK